MSADCIEASLAGDRARAAALLGCAVPDNWPPHPDVFALRYARVSIDPGAAPWLTRVIVDKAAGCAVGVAGFHGPPGGDWLAEYAPGGVEFGYTVFEPYRRRGLAKEAGQGLVDWASAEHRVSLFVLSMAPDNAASAAVARSLGFAHVGEWTHPVRGVEHVYRLDASAGDDA